MAKAARPSTDDPNRWHNLLKPEYETLATGFHAGLTVTELIQHMDMNTDVPKNIRTIKIGSFTPEMFEHPEWVDFWKQHVPQNKISPALQKALNDPHVQEVHNHVGHTLDTQTPTLETIVRLAQAQYIGYHIRVGEKTSAILQKRIEKLRSPEGYKKLRNAEIIVQNKLQQELPIDPPYFELTKQEFSVKGVSSAIEKAYKRTGQPKNAKEFLDDPDKFGVFAINDLQRFSIKISRSPSPSPKEIEENYCPVRNVIVAALLSGELGVALNKNGHSEIICSTLYPPSTRIKDQIPCLVTKGQGRYPWAEGTYISMPVEIQIPLLSDKTDKITHTFYKTQRTTEDEMAAELKKGDAANAEKIAVMQNTIKSCEQMRLMYFEDGLPESFKKIRADHRAGKNVVMHDPMIYFLDKYDMFEKTAAAKHKAVLVAYNEIPEEERRPNGQAVLFDPFAAKHHQPTSTQNILHTMIQDSGGRVIAISASDKKNPHFKHG